ncbi:unnamed protein product, partial [Mesorhabditis spiculigera]
MLLAVPTPTESDVGFPGDASRETEVPWVEPGYQEIPSGFSSETNSPKLSDSGHALSPRPILKKGPRIRRPCRDPRQALLDPELPSIPSIVVDETPRATLRPSSGLTRRKSFKDRIVEVSKDVNRMQRDLREELKENVIEFMDTTTAHGIPMVMSTKSIVMRVIWVCFSFVSLCVFIYQCRQVHARYSKNDKIVNVALMFESPPFPSITVCNLNPFKKHSIRGISEVRETLDNYHQAVIYSKAHIHEEEKERKKRDANGRPKYPMFRFVQFEPVLSDCDCIRGHDHECIWKKTTVPENLKKACICNFDNLDRTAWPCFNSQTWQESICPECNDMGYCNIPNSTGVDQIPCMCNMNTGYCLLKPASLKHVWHFLGKTIPKAGSPFLKDYLEKLRSSGYENVTDQVTITTVTKELLIMQMASVEEGHRAALSYGKEEFIKMCSFNGKQCDISRDFKPLVDPSFGNCFTFNWNRKSNKTSSRAGPNHGLRMMLYVNVTDYLPTTEATGVRIVIHGKKDRPFPDTFGYSAPTGAVSSFGISLRQVNRIHIPEDPCYDSQFSATKNNIYEGYDYTPEGCYRTLYQKEIQKKCGCADPRFPRFRLTPDVYEAENCDTMDIRQRECILMAADAWQKNNDNVARKNTKKPQCRHPCQEEVYSTTYSAAKWPSSDINVDCHDMRSDECIKHYSENAAMLEIYYEQLSYEILSESEVYLLVNMVSDIGGQAGLWLGASVLTLIEIMVLAFNLATACCRRCEPKRKGSTEEDTNNNEKLKHARRRRRRIQ